MNDREYEEYLKELNEEYENFMRIAKKIKPEDLSDSMKSLKSKSVLLHIKLRTTLQKFRKSSCGCEFKGN
jgi:hypothetical protein